MGEAAATARCSSRWLPSEASDYGTLEVIKALESEHHQADLGNRINPIEELVYIALTRQTHQKNALQSWQAIADAGGVAAILEMSERQLQHLLRPAGLSKQKARWIKGSLSAIVHRFGELSLSATTLLAFTGRVKADKPQVHFQLRAEQPRQPILDAIRVVVASRDRQPLAIVQALKPDSSHRRLGLCWIDGSWFSDGRAPMCA